MSHPAIQAGRTAVVTGAASGIGLATAKRFASLGMRVCLADLPGEALDAAGREVARDGAPDAVMTAGVDVADRVALERLEAAVRERFGEVAVLMNNAVTRNRGTALGSPEAWVRALDVNLWGVVHGTQVFAPAMIGQSTPCAVVNVGSKQGITNPPGNTAYNTTKAAVKAYTEALAHDLRSTDGCLVSAHLLIPGWTTTGDREHQAGAWRPEQVVDAMLAALDRGDFYILCPDGETTPEMDRKRIVWSALDVVDNRPALSRWHPEHAGAYERFEPPS